MSSLTAGTWRFLNTLRRMVLTRSDTARLAEGHAAVSQGLTLAHVKAQLEDRRDTSLTLELNLCTFGPHPRISLSCVGDKVSLS